jgi:hypothetical protein
MPVQRAYPSRILNPETCSHTTARRVYRHGIAGQNSTLFAYKAGFFVTLSIVVTLQAPYINAMKPLSALFGPVAFFHHKVGPCFLVFVNEPQDNVEPCLASVQIAS